MSDTGETFGPPGSATERRAAAEQRAERAERAERAARAELAASSSPPEVAVSRLPEAAPSSSEEFAYEYAERGEPHPSVFNPDTSTTAIDVGSLLRTAGTTRVNSLVENFGTDALVLGDILFQVPPLAIRINKGNMAWQWKPLRANNAITVKSGQGECFIEIDLAFVGLYQINEVLRPLIRLWKLSPFSFIENLFIRSMMLPESPEETMMVCLETLVMDTVAGKPNTVFATLLLRWFNYKPYSKNFFYRRTWEGLNAGAEAAVRARARAQEQEAAIQAETMRLVNEQGEALLASTDYPEEDRDDITLGMENAWDQIEERVRGEFIDTAVAAEAPEEMVTGLPQEPQILGMGGTGGGDQFIGTTDPCVYPWNSRPYMNYLRNTPIESKEARSWTDGISLGWDSLVRRQIPSNWAYQEVGRGTREVASTRRTYTEIARPRPVSSTSPEGDIVLVIGDSITVGYLNSASPGTLEAPVLYTQTRFPIQGGKQVYCLARQGASTAEMKTALERLPSGWDLWGRVVGAIIMGGINDANGSVPAATIMNNLSSMANTLMSKDGGAIVALVTPTPVKDTTLGSTKEAIIFDLCQRVIQWGQQRGADRRVAINSHFDGQETVLSAVNTSFEGRIKEEYRNDTNLHPRGRAYQVLATHISSKFPWSGLRPSVASSQWRVTNVEDGDTITVRSVSGGEERKVRLFCADTYETYLGPQVDTTFRGRVIEAFSLSMGQDTGRPENVRWGNLAKIELGRLGVRVGTRVEIIFYGRDAYRRHLGIVKIGGVEINLEMVRRGLAFAMVSSDDRVVVEEGQEEQSVLLARYQQAQHAAEGRSVDGQPAGSRQGFWADLSRNADPPESWHSLSPATFRREFPPPPGG